MQKDSSRFAWRVFFCLTVGLVATASLAAESLESAGSSAESNSAASPSATNKSAATRTAPPQSGANQSGANQQPKPAAKPAPRVPPVLLTPEREAAALQFVRDHHPELVDLLKGLKTAHPAQYQAAVRQLYQTSERLAKIHEADPERYEVELKLWKIKSRIHLLAARASLSRDPEIESQLKTALAEQAQVQLEDLRLDRDRAAERLKTYERLVDQFQSNEQQNLDKQFKLLMTEVDRQRMQSAAKSTAIAKQKTSQKLANPANAISPSKTTPPDGIPAAKPSIVASPTPTSPTLTSPTLTSPTTTTPTTTPTSTRP